MPQCYFVVAKNSAYINRFDITKFASKQRGCEEKTFKAMELLPHQQDLVHHFKSKRFTSPLLVLFSMGAGKTVGALSCASTLAPKSSILILCDITIIGQWVEAIRRLPVNKTIHFTVMSYTDYERFMEIGHTRFDMGIVDESHCFRNLTPRMQNMLDHIRRIPILLYLTGTPIVNSKTDAFGLSYIFTGRPDARLEEFSERNIIYYDPKDDPSKRDMYPTVITDIQPVPMTWPQTLYYFSRQKSIFKLGGFEVQQGGLQNRYRKSEESAANFYKDALSSPKLVRIVNNIQSMLPHGKQVLYSSRLGSGLDPLGGLLHQRGIVFGRIDGSTTPRERTKIIKMYNVGSLNILLISPASSRGVDLMNTFAFHITEPLENVETQEQCLNRAVRYKSHDKKNNSVRVIHYISSFPTGSIPNLDKELTSIFGERMRVRTQDVIKELQAMVTAQKTTVNEDQMIWNTEKNIEVQKCKDILIKNAIAMPSTTASISVVVEKEMIKQQKIDAARLRAAKAEERLKAKRDKMAATAARVEQREKNKNEAYQQKRRKLEEQKRLEKGKTKGKTSTSAKGKTKVKTSTPAKGKTEGSKKHSNFVPFLQG